MAPRHHSRNANGDYASEPVGDTHRFSSRPEAIGNAVITEVEVERLNAASTDLNCQIYRSVILPIRKRRLAKLLALPEVAAEDAKLPDDGQAPPSLNEIASRSHGVSPPRALVVALLRSLEEDFTDGLSLRVHKQIHGLVIAKFHS